MKEIVELVREVFTKRIPRIELLQEDARSRNTLYYKIYEEIREGRVTTNNELAALLYNDNIYNNNYRKLTTRFKERLYNTVLFVQPRQGFPKSYMHDVYYCYKHQVIAHLLITIGAQRSGQNLMKKVLSKAEPLQLFDVVQQCSLALRRSSLLSGKQEDYKYYNNLFIEANNKLLADNKAEELYYSIIINFSQSLSPKPDLAKQAKEYIDELEKIKENYDTFQINLYYSRLKIVYHQLINDYKTAINICDQLEDYLLKSNIFYTRTIHANLLIIKLDSCLMVHDYEQGTACAEKALGFYMEGVENWFILLELYFLLSLNTNNIEKAVEIFLKATENERFKNIQPQRREIWGIYGGYLSFLLHYKEEHYDLLNKLTRQKPEFKFSRLINEIPIYAKDKKGMNVAVLILQILILLQNKSYIQISKRTEALYQYTYRNLNKDDAYRSHYFIKMLIAMEKSSFNFEDTIRKTGRYLEKLRMENVQYSPTQTRMEIIPYEDLWNIILNILQRNK